MPFSDEEIRARAEKQFATIEAREKQPWRFRYHSRFYDDTFVPLDPETVAEVERDVMDHDPADDAYCDRDPGDRLEREGGRL